MKNINTLEYRMAVRKQVSVQDCHPSLGDINYISSSLKHILKLYQLKLSGVIIRKVM